jgi:HK97 family phage major capsid protein
VTNDGVGYLPVTEKTIEAWRAIDTKNMETKAVPTLTAVVEPQRLGGIVQQTPDDMLILRDVLNIGRTNSNAVSWIRESTYTPVAVTVVETGATAKPEAALTATEQTSTVRTIAAWMPATVQQLADWPALRSLIDSRLLYDIRLKEEEQIMYGGGTGTDFTGIFVDAGVAAIARGTANLVDRIRAGMTDVLVAGGIPTAAIVHPLDWEAILFLKGTDGHYLGQVFPAAGRQARLWSMPIVESVSCQARAGDATEAINLAVGDFRRAATLWMRSDATVQLGMQQDDFTKNKRTILGEERAAFGIQTPAWIRKHETVAAVP